jgi:hypothetical protein
MLVLEILAAQNAGQPLHGTYEPQSAVAWTLTMMSLGSCTVSRVSSKFGSLKMCQGKLALWNRPLFDRDFLWPVEDHGLHRFRESGHGDWRVERTSEGLDKTTQFQNNVERQERALYKSHSKM